MSLSKLLKKMPELQLQTRHVLAGPQKCVYWGRKSYALPWKRGQKYSKKATCKLIVCRENTEKCSVGINLLKPMIAAI